MQDVMFENILRSIKMPIGQMLDDGKTYRVVSKEYIYLLEIYKQELQQFDKFLVLTSDGNTVVGGILFYGNYDIQAQIFDEYRGMHFMSQIHKNGILKSECYENQRVTLKTEEIESFADFLKKKYLLDCIDLNIANLREVYRYMTMFKESKEFSEISEYSEKQFLEKFS